MFKGLFLSCPHYTEQSPIMRKDGYGDQILDKLRFALEYAENDDRHVFCAGDLFHRKSGTSIREINKMIELLKQYDPMYVTLGNHDIQAFSQIIETQPIGVLIKAGVVTPIGDRAIEFDDIVLTGSDYHAHYEESEPWSRKADSNCDTHIHITHALITDTSLPFECIDVQTVAETMSADILVNGHYHKYWEDPEAGIYNVGSIARVAMDKNSINKTPVALLIDCDGKKRTVTTLVIPIEKDVWISEIKRDTLSADEVEEFAKSIEEMDISTDEKILEEILKDEDGEVRKLVYKYLGE